MKLYLIRHAEAKPKIKGQPRDLTPEGVETCRQLLAMLQPMNLRASAIWHSRKPRAIQTAQILAPGFRCRRELKARTGLNPTDPTAPIARELRDVREDLAIVGHEPFLGKLACRLLGGIEPETLDLPKASILCLERSEDATWRLRWFLPAELAGRFARNS